jgi:hypothetical protein
MTWLLMRYLRGIKSLQCRIFSTFYSVSPDDLLLRMGEYDLNSMSEPHQVPTLKKHFVFVTDHHGSYRGAPKLTVESLKLAWAKFSTIS